MFIRTLESIFLSLSIKSKVLILSSLVSIGIPIIKLHWACIPDFLQRVTAFIICLTVISFFVRKLEEIFIKMIKIICSAVRSPGKLQMFLDDQIQHLLGPFSVSKKII